MQIVKSINDICSTLGDAFTKDKVSFEAKLTDVTSANKLRELHQLLEQITEKEEMPLETPIATEVEPDKPNDQ